jgi:CubicO group peptidase (beta-lactamase class C family)
VEALRQVVEWPVEHAAVAVVRRTGEHVAQGDERVYDWKSVTKLATALAVLVASEEGIVDLDEPAGPPGSTIRHLLAHASGLPLEAGEPIARPGARRIYSNAGFELLAATVAERAEMPFDRYLAAAVLEPLEIVDPASLRGSPASGLVGTIRHLTSLAAELLRPRLVAEETLREAASVAFPGLVGVLPGFGRMEPNDWGLGFELRDAKRPHWTGEHNSERTFGHFGQSGSFLWVDPDADLACACLTDRRFAEWAKEAWPRLSDAVLAEAGGTGAARSR